MNIYYQNVRGLNTKSHIFYRNCSDAFFDIICISESWLSDGVRSSELFPPSYSVYRGDRKHELVDRTRGGGVALAVRSDIHAQLCNVSDYLKDVPLIDVVLCKCKHSGYSFFLGAVYIPPDTSASELTIFLDVMESLLVDAPVLLIGDFNIATFGSGVSFCPKGQLLRSFMDVLELKQYNKIRNVHGRFLDLAVSNMDAVIESRRELCPFVKEDAHHPALDFVVEFKKAQSTSDQFLINNVAQYNFRRADLCGLYGDLSSVCWYVLESFSDIDEMVSHFYYIIYNLFNIHVPRIVNRVSKYPKWYTRELIGAVKLKNRLHRVWKRSGAHGAWSDFCTQRSKCVKMVDDAYSSYIKKAEQSVNADPNTFWKFVNDKKGVSRIPSVLHNNDITYETPLDIVNAFADVFSSVYQTPSGVFQSFQVDESTCFGLQYVERDDIRKIMKNMPARMTAGDDCIPSFVLRDCCQVLDQPLTMIINLAIKSCKFPSRWKTARVVPVHKKGDKGDVKNYRPVSILNNFSKVLERVIYSTVLCNTDSMISDFQHGFRPKRSVATNLAVFTQYVSRSLDARKRVDVIYTDFSKAFDSLDISTLLHRLGIYGASRPLLKLFASYLMERKAYVSYNGFQSEMYNITSGVPQGSNLGPLMFVLFIDPLLKAFTCRVAAYADDIKIFHEINDERDVALLQHNINFLCEWCKTNGLILNIEKCHSVSFARIKFSPHGYNIDASVLPSLELVRDLGVYFTSALSFSYHIEQLASSACKILGFIKRMSSDFENITAIKTLYFAFVLSKIEYCSIIWHPFTATHTALLNRVHRNFLKYLSFRISGVYPLHGVPTRVLLDQHNVMGLESRRDKLAAKFIWKLLRGEYIAPELLEDVTVYVPGYSLRSAPTFYMPTPRTNVLKYSPLYNMCRAAQDLCSDVFL